ncbi:pilus assembly protein CpaE [Ornithinicoccus halotolerans]|uniref:pilus assembly protein CpaE n=1 Tax=Ornithinicoccus halotolerans TaxID=1748220 RepID=UPI00129575A9|nr:pilus assembly protein CpaE [Ornithinicoccus halotolerans]
MITIALARQLQEAGMIWSPMPGDRFVVTSPGMEEDVFYLADMTVEVHRFVGGSVIGFNGVAEWALDSVDLEDTLWLPREDQMRAVLGPAFVRLARADGPVGAEREYVVVVDVGGQEEQAAHHDAECAYAHALLTVLRSQG